MTRVVRRAASAQAVRARTKGPRSKVRKHKIIMESITQEKKKLRSVISFEAKAPPGYTFIPAGNPRFTTSCKEVCRKDGLKVFTVSTTPHQRLHNLSQQVHRIGYHFPSVVVASVCMEKGLFLSSTGKVMPYHRASAQAVSGGFGQVRLAESQMTQDAINREARDTIKDLFPNIPERDLGQIIKTAFQKGKRKVGTAVELPLARRAQLAVVAHIRHVYTDYDRLLRITSFQDARSAVEQPTLALLVQWRGDDENGATVLEDVFREVIVISDDEDGDESDASQDQISPQERDSSIEIVSSNALAGDIQTQPVNFAVPPTADRTRVQDISEDEAPPGFRLVTESTRRRKASDKKRPDRRGFNRYQAWDQARIRYREGGYSASTNIVDLSTDQYSISRPVFGPLIEGNRVRQDPLVHPARKQLSTSYNPTRQFESSNGLHNVIRRPAPIPRSSMHEFQDSRSGPPDVIHFADGSVFERADGTGHAQKGAQPPNLKPVPVSWGPMGISPEDRAHPRNTSDIHEGGPLCNPTGHRILPSIEVLPQPSGFREQPRGQTDFMPRKRVPMHEPHIEGISDKVETIDINGGSAFPRKKQRVDQDKHPHWDSRGEISRQNARPLPASETGGSPHITQGRSSPRDARATRLLATKPLSSFSDENSFLYHEQAQEAAGRPPSTSLAGYIHPTDFMPRSTHMPEDTSDHTSGYRYQGPVSPNRRPKSPSGRDLVPLSPPKFSSASHHSGFTTKNDGRVFNPVRPSGFDGATARFPYSQNHFNSRGQALNLHEDYPRSPEWRHKRREGYHFLSDSENSEFSHNVPPSQLVGPPKPFKHGPQDFGPQQRKAGFIPPGNQGYKSSQADGSEYMPYDMVSSRVHMPHSCSPPPQPTFGVSQQRGTNRMPVQREPGGTVYQPQPRPLYDKSHGRFPGEDGSAPHYSKYPQTIPESDALRGFLGEQGYMRPVPARPRPITLGD